MQAMHTEPITTNRVYELVKDALADGISKLPLIILFLILPVSGRGLAEVFILSLRKFSGKFICEIQTNIKPDTGSFTSDRHHEVIYLTWIIVFKW